MTANDTLPSAPPPDAARTAQPGRATPVQRTRVGVLLASPLGIVVSVPGLVALVGVFLTLLGDQALRGSNLDMARERLSEETRLVAASLRYALGQSEPVLDRLAVAVRSHDPSRPFDAFAHGLADLLHGRPGIAYVSASFPDGTFQGAYLDDDHVIRFQDSRVEASGGTRVRRYHLRGRDALELQREERTDYDPRGRSFYRLAVEKRARAWTAPYPFYKTHYTGVTRTEPIFVGSVLHAVITVDFDVNVMSTYLKERQLPGMRALLYSSDGTLLAYPQGASRIAKLPLRSDRPLRYDDLRDPVLSAFFASPNAKVRDRLQFDAFEASGERFLIAVAPASNDPGLPWFVAYLAPESYFLRELHAYERRSFVIALSAVLTAMLVGWLLARHIVRAREEVARARAEAQAARKAARELGSYRLIACLGRGGMGEVWKAEHRLLAREAAIKLIRPDEDKNVAAEMNSRFRREAEAIASLRSRNTIELFDYGVAEDGTFYYVMELLDGMDLESLVADYGPQPAARVIDLLVGACNSLAEAHDAGLIHRDIKPANLFTCRAADEVDVVKVLDFGLVRAATATSSAVTLDSGAEILGRMDAAGKLTQAGGFVGTPAYMAPEQALGQPMDHRADLYALGCVAYWLLSGQLVFDGESALKLMIAHVQEQPRNLRPLVKGFLPEELVQIISRCLEKSAADRPLSARELGAALRAVPIPREHAWSEERAHAWWNQYRPRKRSLRGPPDASRELKIAAGG